MAANVKSLASISPMCLVCKGKCWNPDSQKATQEAAMKMFGVIPNHCVNSEGNIVMCPAQKGLI